MSKFHINSQGEPGLCSAKQGGCPFGGESDHHESPEAARRAYEENNSSNMVSTIKRKKPEGSFAPNLTRSDFEEIKKDYVTWRSRTYEELVFDEQELREKYAAHASIDDKITELRDKWNEQSRTHRAVSGETIQARLIPLDSKVLITDPDTGDKKRVTIKTVAYIPQSDGTTKRMAQYRYKGKDHFVDPYDRLEVETASDGPVPKGFNQEWNKAYSLFRDRSEAHTMNPEEWKRERIALAAMKGQGGERNLAVEEDIVNKQYHSKSRLKHPGIVDGARIPDMWNPIRKGEKLWNVSSGRDQSDRVAAVTEDEAKEAFIKDRAARGIEVKNVKLYPF